MSLDLQLIRECLHFSALAYDEFDFENPLTNTQGLARRSVEDEGTLIIAFRGSREPRDFIMDAKFLQKRDWPTVQGGAKVHRGFHGCWFSVAAEVARRAQSAQRIIFTGHSLGAAVATLAAIDFKAIGYPVWKVVTFGSPRVGNAAFRDLYDANLHDETLRVVAQGDPVTVTPPYWSCGYRHLGRELYLPNAGGYKLEPAIWTKVVPVVQSIRNAALQEKLHHNLALFGPHALTNYARLIGNLA